MQHYIEKNGRFTTLWLYRKVDDTETFLAWENGKLSEMVDPDPKGPFKPDLAFLQLPSPFFDSLLIDLSQVAAELKLEVPGTHFQTGFIESQKNQVTNLKELLTIALQK